MLLGWEDYTPDARAAFGTENEHPRDTLLVAIRELIEKVFCTSQTKTANPGTPAADP